MGVGASAGCVGEADDLDDADFRVINGLPASSDTPEYAATVAVHWRSGDQVSVSPFCSGTLIYDDVVLSAAHCCDEANGGPNFDALEPEEVAIYFGDGPAFANNTLDGEFYGEFYAVSEIEIHADYSRFSLENDICLLRLSVPNQSSPTVPPLPASLGLSDDDAGTLLDHVGFGYSDLAKTEYGVKLHAEVPMAGLGCVVFGCPSGGSDGQFSYVQDGDPYFGTCNGDSGGPAFIERSGQTYVAGITSYGDAGCEVYGVSTNVSAYESFIAVFAGVVPSSDCSADGMCNGKCAAGEDPDCGEGEPATCDSDGVCEAGESCDGRDGTDACPGDCPGQTKGKPWERYCYVGGACEGPGC